MEAFKIMIKTSFIERLRDIK